ncbi:MAG: class I SAM-dependent methyltransferase [Halapricum sp.]
MARGDVAVFDRFARYYDFVMPGAKATQLGRALDLADRPVARLVDLGGGTGRATQALSADERVVLDAARGMLERARSHDLACVQGDASRLPLTDGSVDAITIVDALHHVYDWDGVFTEAFRVLGPGGVFVVSDFDPTTLLGRGLVAAEHLVGFESRFLSPRRLCEHLESVGFETVVLDTGFGYTVAGVVPKRESRNHSTPEE